MTITWDWAIDWWNRGKLDYQEFAHGKPLAEFLAAYRNEHPHCVPHLWLAGVTDDDVPHVAGCAYRDSLGRLDDETESDGLSEPHLVPDSYRREHDDAREAGLLEGMR